MTVYADSTSVSNPVVPGSNTVLCHGPLRRNTLSGRGGYDCLVKVFKTKLSSPKRSSLLLKSIACSFEYFYRAVMAATVWRCDAAEQTAAQTALNTHSHPPPPYPFISHRNVLSTKMMAVFTIICLVSTLYTFTTL